MTSPLAVAPVEESPRQTPPINQPTVAPPTAPPTSTVQPNNPISSSLCVVTLCIH